MPVLKCRFGKGRKVTCTFDRRDGPGSTKGRDVLQGRQTLITFNSPALYSNLRRVPPRLSRLSRQTGSILFEPLIDILSSRQVSDSSSVLQHHIFSSDRHIPKASLHLHASFASNHHNPFRATLSQRLITTCRSARAS